MIQKIAYFLHLIDDDSRLNLEDIAFCVILGKIAFSSNVDWAALVTLAVCCLNMMHKRHVDATLNTSTLQAAIQTEATSVQNLTAQVTPIINAVEEHLK